MLVLHQFLYVLLTLRCTFYAFSGTNLLTRCRSASSCFLLFLYSRKVVQEIFSELDETKKRSSYFHVTKTESDGETKRSHRVATPGLGAARPGPAPRGGVGPPGVHRPRPSAYLFSVTGKPCTPEHNSTKSSVAAVIANPSSGGF